jgi:hypothetical protein
MKKSHLTLGFLLLFVVGLGLGSTWQSLHAQASTANDNQFDIPQWATPAATNPLQNQQAGGSCGR